MNYTVKEIIETYNRRGDVVKTEARVVFESDSVADTMLYRYGRKAKHGYLLELNDRRRVSLATVNSTGEPIFFSEMFAILEGQEAFDAVMRGDAPAQVESEYVAALQAAA